MKVKLRDVCDFYSGTGFPSEFQGETKGQFPFYKVGDISKNVLLGQQRLTFSENYVDMDVINKIKGTIVPANTVVFAKIGEALKLNRRAITNCECLIDNNTIGIKAKTMYIRTLYFYYFMCNLDMQKFAESTTVPSVRKSKLMDISIILPTLDEQQRIEKVLDQINDIIVNRQKQLKKLDELVKSRFIEMFGDPEENNKNMLMKSMTDICKIIDGDRGKSYPKQEEFLQKGYCLFLNAKNVTQEGFVFKSCLYITQEKDSVLRNGKLERGDIVLTTRGTIGNLAFYNEKVPFNNIRINSGMVILRLNRKFIKEKFFIEQFKFLLSSIKNKIASGSAQPQLPISTMYKIKIILPPMILQEKFVSFLEHTDKSKLEIQKSLDKLEILKKSLMQQYFG